MAQSVEHPTLDFSSGHDPKVMGLSPTSGSVLGVEPAWDKSVLTISQSLHFPTNIINRFSKNETLLRFWLSLKTKETGLRVQS